jgi:hypothetical protein
MDMKTRRLDWTERLVRSLMGLAAACMLTSCAHANGKLVLTEDAVHDSLARVDDQVRTFCTASENVEKFKAPCTDVRKVLVPTLEAGAAFNRAVADQKVAGLATLVEAVGHLATEIKKLPQGQTATLITELAKAIAAASQSLGTQ